jgi:ElaB/YqjD/DUF883 family membrane-anchored ribosome-binding protein
METKMAQAQETRQRRRNNGALKDHVGHVREDITGLRKDVSALANDLGALATAQWNTTTQQLQVLRRSIVERANGGAHYAGEQVRAHPLSALGVAAGAGFLLGLVLSRRR